MTTLKDMHYDDAELGKILEHLYLTHRKRDLKLKLRNALVFRRTEGVEDEKLGIHIPSPYDQSKLIIRHLSGLIAQTAQHWTAKISVNKPRVVVQPTVEGNRRAAQRQFRDATLQEHLLHGILHNADAREKQREVSWDQITEGAGWYFCYERLAGFGLPDRRYFELDEVDLEDDNITDTPVARPDGTYGYAERPDLYEARAREKLQSDVLDGQSLFMLEHHSDSEVYAEKDARGWKFVAIVEYVNASEYGKDSEMAKVAAKFRGEADLVANGIILDASGRVAGGTSEGGAMEEPKAPSRGEHYIQVKVWTRAETYTFITRAWNFAHGKIVWGTPHDYGEVPAYPVPFTATGKKPPEERFLPALEAAFATIPGYNQVVTLLSQMSSFNAIPRFWLQQPEGQGPLVDPRTGAPKLYESESTVGLNPEEMEIIKNGGRLEQIVLQGTDDLINLMAIFQSELADELPSEAARGTGGTSGPAHTTRLLQDAQDDLLGPAVEYHAAAVQKMAQMMSRVIRKRGVPVFLLAAPGKNFEADTRALVELKPERISLNLTVSQSPNTREQQIVLMQTGITLLNNPTPLIDLHEFHEHYAGANDPQEATTRSLLQVAFNVMTGQLQVPPETLIAEVIEIVRGLLPLELAAEMPQVARALAAQSVADQPETIGGGGATRAAGISEPGVNQPATLEGLGVGPPPAGGGGSGYAGQPQNTPGGVPALP